MDLLRADDVDPAWWEDPEAARRLGAALRDAGVADDFERVVRETLRSCIHSVLATIDGATALAERFRLDLVDEEGMSLGDELHEGFIAHLFDTGRAE
jgi:hypothetical protein